MPATNTITSSDITTFASGTTISSAEMNTQFSVWRGNLLPVDPTSSAADATLAYNLGSAEYRFGDMFSDQITLGQTTASWKIRDATTAAGNLEFVQNSTVIKSIAPITAVTTTALIGGVAMTATFSAALVSSTSFVAVAGSTITINMTGQRPIYLGFRSVGDTNSTVGLEVVEFSSSQFLRGFLGFSRDSTYLGQERLGLTKISADADGALAIPISALSFLDIPGTITANYSLSLKVISGDGFKFDNVQFYAYEL